MHTTANQQTNLVDLIPTPTELRLIIGRRYAELTVLRRLLKAAESKARLCPDRPQEATYAPAH